MWNETAIGDFASAADVGPSRNRTRFPIGTTARIFRRSRSVVSSAAADAKAWRLRFRGPGKRFIEPLMGWTGSTDPLNGLELRFPTLESAIRYARGQGLDFMVDGDRGFAPGSACPLHQKSPPPVVEKHAA